MSTDNNPAESSQGTSREEPEEKENKDENARFVKLRKVFTLKRLFMAFRRFILRVVEGVDHRSMSFLNVIKVFF